MKHAEDREKTLENQFVETLSARIQRLEAHANQAMSTEQAEMSMKVEREMFQQREQIMGEAMDAVNEERKRYDNLYQAYQSLSASQDGAQGDLTQLNCLKESFENRPTVFKMKIKNYLSASSKAKRRGRSSVLTWIVVSET